MGTREGRSCVRVVEGRGLCERVLGDTRRHGRNAERWNCAVPKGDCRGRKFVGADV